MEQIIIYLIIGIAFLMLVYLFLIYHRLGHHQKRHLRIYGDYVLSVDDGVEKENIELMVYNLGNYDVELATIGLFCNKRFIVANQVEDGIIKIPSHSSYKLKVNFEKIIEMIKKATNSTIDLKIKVFALQTDGKVRFGKGKHLVEIIEHYYYLERINETEVVEPATPVAITNAAAKEETKIAVTEEPVKEETMSTIESITEGLAVPIAKESIDETPTLDIPSPTIEGIA